MEIIKIGKYEILKFTFNFLSTNTYLLNLKNTTLIIDPANSSDKETQTLLEHIKSDNIIIFNTHGHFDHIFGNAILKTMFKKSKLIIHELDSEKLTNPTLNGSIKWELNVVSPKEDISISQESDLVVEDEKINILHTPGHTKGSICLAFDGFVFTGDTLFAGTVGIAKEFHGAFEELINSIKTKLFNLKDDYIILPGHGENSTLKEEKEYNPFLN